MLARAGIGLCASRLLFTTTHKAHARPPTIHGVQTSLHWYQCFVSVSTAETCCGATTVCSPALPCSTGVTATEGFDVCNVALASLSSARILSSLAFRAAAPARPAACFLGSFRRVVCSFAGVSSGVRTTGSVTLSGVDIVSYGKRAYVSKLAMLRSG